MTGALTARSQYACDSVGNRTVQTRTITSDYFSAAHAQPPLRAPASAEIAGGNGVYVYFGGFPIHSYYHANYWVDVVFQTALSTTTTLTTTVTTTAITYTYDPLSRLTDATYSNGQRFQYAYDAVGNRTTQTATITSTQVTAYQYDAANRLTNAGGVAYTWDNNGNLINDGSATYLYDRANQLISTTLSGVTSLYAYNGDGARLRQIIAGVPTTYTQDLASPLPVVLQSKTGAATTPYLYAIGTRPLAQYTSGSAEYLLPDALGSVRQIVDANGNVTLAKSYEPYGSVLSSNGTASSIFGYSGEQIDTTGLIYLRARYMNPGLGIFLARDPWSGEAARPESMNGWNYANGAPINYTDRSGLTPDSSDECEEDDKCKMIQVVYFAEGGFTAGVKIDTSQQVNMTWQVKDAKKCTVVQFYKDALRFWETNTQGGPRQYNRPWDSRVEAFTLDNDKQPAADVGWIARFDLPMLLGWRGMLLQSFVYFQDAPGNNYQIPPAGGRKGFEWWFNAKTSLYDNDRTLMANPARFHSPEDPPPVPGSTIEWGIKFDCEFGANGKCTVVTQPGPGLP